MILFIKKVISFFIKINNPKVFKLNNSNKYIKQVKLIINDPIELICNASTV